MFRSHPYQTLQVGLFFILVLFGLAILMKWVTVPDGTSGEWFKQVWTVFLLVLSPQALAAAMTRSSGGDPDKATAPSETPPGDQAKSEGGFVSLRILPVVAVAGLLMLMLAGCATTGTAPTPQDSPQILAGKSLLAVQKTIVTAAQAVDGLCKSGVMTVDRCVQARAAYELAKPAYDSAMDAYLLMQQGGDPAAFAATLQRAQSLAGNLLQLSGPLITNGGAK